MRSGPRVLLMNGETDLIQSTDIDTPGGKYRLVLRKEDLSAFYPGMIRFTIMLLSGERIAGTFRTNTYEYSPLMPLEAERVAFLMAEKWERELTENPREFLDSLSPEHHREPMGSITDVVVVQGSPRADGNCSILAGWAIATVHQLGKTVQVIYPHDMDIKPCSGCYQCYNTGTCTIDDDMNRIIIAFRHALLVVICTPVYTNTVPGDLKIVIDRFLAYHAERTLGKIENRPKGLLFSVSGRSGRENFVCITKVVHAFMHHIGIVPAGDLLIDGMDTHRDVRNISGTKDQVENLIRSCFLS
jgi:multimeric flavodoxin WrbA